MPDIDIKRHSCDDYSLIHRYPYNRTPSDRLIKKVRECNLLEDNPVKVRLEPDGFLYYVDGGHRLEAAKQLKLTFYYEYVLSTLPAVDLIKQYNANSKSFKLPEYIDLYANAGNADYKRLQDYHKIPYINGIFLRRVYFGFSDKGIKSGVCKVPILDDKKIQALTDIAELSQFYKALCINEGIRRSKDYLTSVVIYRYLQSHKKVTKGEIKDFLVTTVLDRTPSEDYFYKNLRINSSIAI
jgi:hypothetical protein